MATVAPFGGRRAGLTPLCAKTIEPQSKTAAAKNETD
jgi:hypothetical protein